MAAAAARAEPYEQLPPRHGAAGEQHQLRGMAVTTGVLLAMMCVLLSLSLLVLAGVSGGSAFQQISGFGCEAPMSPTGASLRRVANGSCWSHATSDNDALPPLKLDQIRFIVVGDTGRDGFCCQSDVALEMDRVPNVSFVASTGDAFFNSGLATAHDAQVRTSWSDVYQSRRPLPWYAVLGNRDYRGNVDALLELHASEPLWTLPGRFWDRVVKRGRVRLHLVFLDTTPMMARYHLDTAPERAHVESQWPRVDAQLAWLRGTLTGSSPGLTRLVFGHHPVYDSGSERDNALRASLAPLFNHSRVAAYFAGHEHSLQAHRPLHERTAYFISGAGSKIDGYFAAADDGQEFYYDEGPGFVVVTAAVGGALRVDFVAARSGALVHTTTLP